MTLREAFVAAYAWGVAHATAILVVAILLPILGAIGAEIGKGGRTDEDGRVIASVVVGFGVLVAVAELIAVHFAHAYFDAGILDADVRLALAPLVCLVGCLLTVRRVFPLSELAGARSIGALVALLASCWALVWFFGQFRGWSIRFYGGFLTLVLVLVLVFFGLRRLFRRAFQLEDDRR
jgi:hypothetical protein